MANEDPRNHAAEVILADSFGRVRELVQDLCDGLAEEVATYRPDSEANTVSWLVWHLTRVQDDHVSDLARDEQRWTAAGWRDRFALPFDESATGYGQGSDEVGEVRVTAGLLDGYHGDVHERCLAYVGSLPADELARVVDASWDPPVTVGVRLVSLLGDCLQHLGQAAYVRGLAERAG
ncbi:MAG: DUF664 domain-containing protein [Nocardioidaceae bacterium]|nr:DUF664 domain-containing protein [Nocardioidaceae bacterium]